jgi:hypothetical protein
MVSIPRSGFYLLLLAFDTKAQILDIGKIVVAIEERRNKA